MESLQDITLDYITQNLPKDLIKHLQEKTLNDAYKINGKMITMINKVDNKKLKLETGYPFFYWVYKYCPELLFYHSCGTKFLMYKSIMNSKECKECKEVDGIVIIESKILYDKKEKRFYCNFNNKYYWHKISETICNKFPQNLKKFITFKTYPNTFIVSIDLKSSYDASRIINGFCEPMIIAWNRMLGIHMYLPIQKHKEVMYKPIDKLTPEDHWLDFFKEI